MALLSPPTYNPASITYPIEFIFQVANPNPVLYAQAQIFINGLAVSNIEVRPFQSGGGLYLFKINVKAITRQLLAPFSNLKSTIFGDLGQPYINRNPDNFADIGLVVVYFEEDPGTGLPVNIGLTDVVPFGNYAALNATRQREEDLSLNAYTIAPRLPYTNHPQPYKIARGESLFLTIPPVFVNSFRVQTFDAAGALIDTGFVNLTIGFTQQQYTIGIGPEQIAGYVYAFGSVNINNPLINSYSITAGLRFGGPAFLPITIPYFYEFTALCEERSLRVHFMNKLGGGDAFTFTAKKTKSQDSKSKRGRVPLPWNYANTPPSNIYDRGAIKVDNTSFNFYEVESKIYTEEEGAFIAELFDSPETYIETPSGLLPVIVRNKSLKISETDGLLTASAVLEVAVNNSIQTY